VGRLAFVHVVVMVMAMPAAAAGIFTGIALAGVTMLAAASQRQTFGPNGSSAKNDCGRGRNHQDQFAHDFNSAGK
jgi:hypothetical protein